jgi:hypothetical protein
MALNGDQVVSQRTRVWRGEGQPVRLDECRDDDCGLRGPSAVDGGSADTGAGGDTLDGDAPVALFQEDPQRRVEDGSVVADVAGSTRASGRAVSVPSGSILGRHGSLLD